MIRTTRSMVTRATRPGVRARRSGADGSRARTCWSRARAQRPWNRTFGAVIDTGGVVGARWERTVVRTMSRTGTGTRSRSPWCSRRS